MSNIKIPILDIAKTGAFAFVHVGDKLDDIGEKLGPPRYWGFGSEDFFTAYMGFGGVELYFRSNNNIVYVEHGNLRISKFRNNIAKFSADRKGNTIFFELPAERKYLTFDFISKMMRDAGINSGAGTKEEVFSGTTAVINVGSSRFYFYLPDKILEFIEIGNYGDGRRVHPVGEAR
ncbi:hypothetical protein [Labrys monachus]|uniref:Uncharacterized protein n=1 Tax=Labrys monachus TaxID=217067 RepID=A0ABU0FC92_9HYPH|nr:hypothetical protein [Labrys monachus]MDQ0392227.1 hypothetical protein [Labrys monachus]